MTEKKTTDAGGARLASAITELAENWCPQHDRPASECRHTYSIRLYGDTRQVIQDQADRERSDFNTFVTEAAEAMAGFVRCWRCRRRVALEFGNLEGMTLREAVTEATQIAVHQRCKAHETIRIGAEPGTSPSSPLSSGTAMFREPGQ